MSDREAQPGIIAALEAKLDDCQVVNEAGKLFIPDGTLERLLDEDTVHRALLELLSSRDALPINIRKYAHRICDQRFPFRKILGILLLTGTPEAIITFVDLGVNDLFLPMPDPRLLLSSEDHEPPTGGDADDYNTWRSVANPWVKRSHLRNIYATQWSLLAPRFNRQDTIHHYTFTQNHILPFLQGDFKPQRNDETPDPSDEVVRYGSFSQVRKVKIHPSHYDFGDYGVTNPDHQFAVKKLYAHDYEDFTQEIQVYKRYWDYNIRIIPLLATFEVKETIASDPIVSYCLVFPWATGDLKLFWEMNEKFVRNQQIMPWILRECYEITKALMYIHGDSCDPETPDHSFGRHGDVKPSNILWYPNPSSENITDLGKLVLSDFGLADFHRANSRTSSRTASLPWSMTYRAPEFDTTKVISRAIDIWALGCTFLELVTWFLKGNKAVRDEFREYRSEPDIYGIYADMFFRVQHQEGREDVMLKPQVVTWIKGLRGHASCKRYLADLLDIVQCDMLAVDLPSRRTAYEITQKLEVLQ
ncbi:hypothetical protein M426DRAFT_17593 [Hypoxylon sp. CI-4A]|nr:hypothetical protein M426DRAFT_17593 [Hypoxylon sp. CI-4A]